MLIKVTCYEPIGNPQGGWQPVGLEKIFDYNENFSVTHPNKDKNIPNLVYNSKTHQLDMSGETFELNNFIFYKKNAVYYTKVKLGSKSSAK